MTPQPSPHEQQERELHQAGAEWREDTQPNKKPFHLGSLKSRKERDREWRGMEEKTASSGMYTQKPVPFEGRSREKKKTQTVFRSPARDGSPATKGGTRELSFG